MNLVEQIARMIDREGAYGIGFNGTGPNAQPHPFTTRQKYWQATYELLAVEILKKLMATPKDEIRNSLIEFERSGWLRLGVPVDDPQFKELADKTIADKYPIPLSA